MRAFVLAGIMLALVAVAVVTVIVTQQQPDDTEGGMGIPTENLIARPYEDPVPIGGELHVASNGCFHLRTADEQLFVVWPDGYRQDADVVVAPDGTRIGEGQPVAGTGWIRTAEDVVFDADGPDGYLDMVLDYCADDERIGVLQSIE
ncbi:MAG: hypothetical protein KF727_09380 [Microbacteriaceae bacterium]|nr:hypothetical protein [Microbacteriaceae bacterium]